MDPLSAKVAAYLTALGGLRGAHKQGGATIDGGGRFCMSRKTIFLKPNEFIGLVDACLGECGSSRESNREGLGYWVKCPLCGSPMLLLHRPDCSILANCSYDCDESTIIFALREVAQKLIFEHIEVVTLTEADIEKRLKFTGDRKEVHNPNFWSQQCGRIARKPVPVIIDEGNGYREYNPKNPPSTGSAVKSTDDKILEKVANAGYVLAAAIEALVVELKAMNADSELKTEREAIQAEEKVTNELNQIINSYTDDGSIPF